MRRIVVGLVVLITAVCFLSLSSPTFASPLPGDKVAPVADLAVTATINPVADAYVNQSYPTTNYGTAAQLRTDGSPIVKSYVRFSVSGLSGTVSNATLRVYANSSLGTGITANRVADNTWGETTINYGNAPAVGTAIGTSAAVATGTWLSINVTSYVTGNGTFSLALTSANVTALSLASRESTNKPQLVITTATATSVAPTATKGAPTATKAPATATPSGTTGSLTVNPVADAYINQSYPTTNYGTATQLRDDGSPIVRSYLRFNVSGLTSGVSKASLRIYANSSLSTGITANRVADNTWSETAINYGSAPAVGMAIGTSSAVTLGTWVSIDVTSYVTGNGTFGFALTSGNATALSLASRESTNKPQLVIQTGSSTAPTATRLPPTATSVAPTATRVPPTTTKVPPTATRVPPTATRVSPTATRVPPTATRVPPTATPNPVAGTNYYVDSASGSDSNAGTSPTSPWRSLAAVNNRSFQPGDAINFKRGGFWSGGLNFRSSGVQGKPITLRDYGTGTAPIFENPGQYNQSIRVYGSWIVVQNLLVRNAGEAGVRLESGATHNLVQGVEATNVGIGIELYGQYNLVKGNYAHDLHMVWNSPGGDDDYGAEGFWIQAPNNEVAYNRCVRCRASSYDYGSDGGVVEFFGNADNSYVHHNYGTASDGFMEVGGGSAQNVRVAYNVSDNNYNGFACLHLGGNFNATLNNFRIENNTIVKTMSQGYRQLDCLGSAPSASQLLVRNNLFASSIGIANYGSFTHANNLYSMTNGAGVGYGLGSGEKQGNPLFVGSGNYHLQAGSPAINAGMNLGYPLDFDGKSVPQGGVPDLGAYEY